MVELSFAELSTTCRGPPAREYFRSWLVAAWVGLNNDIFGQCFESISTWLEHSDGYVTGFAGVDVFYDARFSCMRTADDFAVCAVIDFASSLRFHFRGSILFDILFVLFLR